MRYAEVDGVKVEAEPGMRGICMSCKSEVLAKCGDIKEWHWAHSSKSDCDDWYEPMTEWHVRSQDMFPLGCREVVIGKHRADVITESGYVVEFQKSSISSGDIINREEFYGGHSGLKGLVWVFDGVDFFENMKPRKKEGRNYHTFRWKWPRQSMFSIESPLFIHPSRQSKYYFQVMKLYGTEFDGEKVRVGEMGADSRISE